MLIGGDLVKGLLGGGDFDEADKPGCDLLDDLIGLGGLPGGVDIVLCSTLFDEGELDKPLSTPCCFDAGSSLSAVAC